MPPLRRVVHPHQEQPQMEQGRPETSYHHQSTGCHEQPMGLMTDQQCQYPHQQHQLQLQHQCEQPEDQDLLGIPFAIHQHDYQRQPLPPTQEEYGSEQYSRQIQYPEVVLLASSPESIRLAGAIGRNEYAYPYGSLDQPGRRYSYMGGLPPCPIGTWSSSVSPTFAPDLFGTFLDPRLDNSKGDWQVDQEPLEAERSLQPQSQIDESSMFPHHQYYHPNQQEEDQNATLACNNHSLGSAFEAMSIQIGHHELDRYVCEEPLIFFPYSPW